jgi:hypothetical protein
VPVLGAPAAGDVPADAGGADVFAVPHPPTPVASTTAREG